jgi:hypothetical protein
MAVGPHGVLGKDATVHVGMVCSLESDLAPIPSLSMAVVTAWDQCKNQKHAKEMLHVQVCDWWTLLLHR